MPTAIGVPNVAPDPNYDAGTTWALANADAGTSWTRLFAGFSSTAVVFAPAGGFSRPFNNPVAFRTSDALYVAVTPGEPLSLSGYADKNAGTTSLTIAAWFYDDADNLVSVAYGTTVVLSVFDEQQVKLEGLTVPAGATRLRVGWAITVMAAGGKVEFGDGFVAVKSNVAVVAGGITVTTEDAAPTTAPHRISRDPAKDDVSAAFAPVHDGRLVPSPDLLPGGTAFPNEVWPDDDTYPDQGAAIPGMVRDIIGWELRSGGIGASGGKLIARRGNRCSPTRLCGTRAAIDPNVSQHGWRSGSGEAITAAFTFADVDDGGADGGRDINVYALTEGQGWS